ncbi:DinB family protein [Oceaniglobus indicus]|uniref:DinB family protein n=1 Tax=Oceaniglobus indicus TaxID=2047749 RepID=UPI000C17A853|nr:DinB family protein [Oceaniglobus indicus]
MNEPVLTSATARTLARYNRWQNAGLYEAAGALDDAARRADRGAFFGSIHGTLSHLMWGDRIWMARFAGWEKPHVGLGESAAFMPDWDVMAQTRRVMDDKMLIWADTLDDAALAGDLAWFSGALGRDVLRPKALCLLHMFNHQTHHRGQVHAMLTAAGAGPGDTDLFAMPADDA